MCDSERKPAYMIQITNKTWEGLLCAGLFPYLGHIGDRVFWIIPEVVISDCYHMLGLQWSYLSSQKKQSQSLQGRPEGLQGTVVCDSPHLWVSPEFRYSVSCQKGGLSENSKTLDPHLCTDPARETCSLLPQTKAVERMSLCSSFPFYPETTLFQWTTQWFLCA